MTSPRKKVPASRTSASQKKISTVEKNAEGKPPRRKPANAGKGRVKGVPNAVTRSVREIFQAFVEGNAAKVQELWDRVARHQPAKALSIYAKLAEFVLPKLQRTELSGHVTGAVTEYPAWEDISPVAAMQVYAEIMQIGKEPGDTRARDGVKFLPPKHSEDYYAGVRAEREAQAARLHHHAAPLPPAPQSPSRHAAAQDAEFTEVPPEREKKVLVIEPPHSGDHQPIADSKCGFCRQLWAKVEEDKLLCYQRPPRVVT